MLVHREATSCRQSSPLTGSGCMYIFDPVFISENPTYMFFYSRCILYYQSSPGITESLIRPRHLHTNFWPQRYIATVVSFFWKKTENIASVDRRAEPLIHQSRPVYQTLRCWPVPPAENHETEPPCSLFLSASPGARSFCPDAHTDVKGDNWRRFSCTGHRGEKKGHGNVSGTRVYAVWLLSGSFTQMVNFTKWRKYLKKMAWEETWWKHDMYMEPTRISVEISPQFHTFF